MEATDAEYEPIDEKMLHAEDLDTQVVEIKGDMVGIRTAHKIAWFKCLYTPKPELCGKNVRCSLRIEVLP